MALDSALRQRIETLLNSNRVVLFMKGSPNAPQCGFSAKAVAALDALGVDYAHSDVLQDGEIREGIKAYGEWPTIPQLYIDGQLIGGSDIIEQMANSGELHGALGLPPPDRTPPTINITPAAAQMLRQAVEDAGGEVVVKLDIDKNFRTRLQLAQDDPGAITAEAEGVRVQFDLSGARRADGLTIDWADDARGRGLVIDNPNAPAPVRGIGPAEANERVAAGSLILVDVRPPDERAQAAVGVAFQTLDGDGIERLRALPKDTALAFLCHHGGRSAQAAEHFRGLGFGNVFNVEGGIDAWANDVDPSLPRY
ncbi:Grx4 family monothiol glutaredoxin [Luteimonas gilva]|uniref:Grx4 family monothiol glutaredoxin n=1 Tax=Luteimonas gilva TaxID=2572684 RepID=A0A4U5JIJ5_9GAMM|nr:Grx4 family monothiol glutaredoxin [Luteimonas gilva]TKR29410.1 Grx4 family monothiol glutaredoxin [Luteimonas gilva]